MFERTVYHMEWVKGIRQKKRIYDFLLATDDIFIPRLSERVDVEAYAKKLSHYAETVFVCLDGKDIASCSLYCDTKIAYVSSFAVVKEYGRRGIGTAMMKEVKKFCRKRACTKIRLEVFGENSRAQKFYQKEGFEVVEYLQGSEIREYSLPTSES